MREPEHEALEHAAAIGTLERRLDAVAAVGDRPRDELERVARAGPAERGPDLDLAPLARPQLRQRALEHLVGDRGSAGGVAAVVAQHVLEGEGEPLAALGDLEHVREYRASIRWTDDLAAARGVADGHGRRARARGARDPGRRPVPRAPERARAAVHAAHQQLDLHAARPRRAAARERARGARGGDLDLRAGDRALPRAAAAGRLGVRHRRGGRDDGAARGGLHAHRARPRLRRARGDPHLQLRAHHARDPADRRRRALHRHQPGRHRPEPRRARCPPPARSPR